MDSTGQEASGVSPPLSVLRRPAMDWRTEPAAMRAPMGQRSVPSICCCLSAWRAGAAVTGSCQPLLPQALQVAIRLGAELATEADGASR